MATQELFTVTWWEVTAAQVIHAAAGGAVAVLASEAVGTLRDVSWYGLLSAAVVAGLTTLLLALAGKLNPNTGPATFLIPTPKAVTLAQRPPARKRPPAKPRPRTPRNTGK